jgi:hypothetical protein
MEKQLRVIKADGTTEAYLHTKVVGAMNNALSAAGRSDITLAERLTEVVTYYLYRKSDRRTVSSNEVFTMVKAVLVATGNEDAATILSDHAIERRLKRARIEVLAIDMQGFADVERLRRTKYLPDRMPWDKTRIVQDLTARAGLPHHTARAVASMVEERVLSMGVTAVPLSLVKQLVLGEIATTLRAEQELHV